MTNTPTPSTETLTPKSAQVSHPTRVRAGLYRGTITVDGRPYAYRIERETPDSSGWRGDWGRWSASTDDTRGEKMHDTLRDAIEAVMTAGWYRHPEYGLCAGGAA